MSAIISPFIAFLHSIAAVVPLPVFTFLGALIEEIIAPIPSPIVMTLAGSLAATSGGVVGSLVTLAIIGSIGKTIGSYFIYIIADKLEDVVLSKFGKFLGVSHREVESIGKHLNKGWRDDIVLFLLRAVPIMPTAPVSLVAGLVKLNLRTYLVSTFLGNIVRNLFYLYVGFTSIGALESVNEGLDSIENIGYVLIFALMAGVVGYFYLQRKKGKGLNIIERFSGHKEE